MDDRTPSDAELVQRILAGDVERFAVLIARYREPSARLALRMLGGDQDEVEDVLQDSFVRAYRALGSCEDPARFGAWLYRIVLNRCRTRLVRLRRRAQTFVPAPDGLEAMAAAPPAQDRVTDLQAVQQALDRLDEDLRAAFLMKHVEGLSYEEMAVATGAGVSALKMRVKRARDRLQRWLQAEAEDEEQP